MQPASPSPEEEARAKPEPAARTGPRQKVGYREAERDKLIAKLIFICDGIVRGKDAKNCWEFQYSRSIRIASVVLSGVGGTGLFSTTALATLAEQKGFVVISSALFSALSLALGILMQLGKEFNIDEKAQDAKSAEDSFDAIETCLDFELLSVDPRQSVEKMFVEVQQLLVKYRKVIPKKLKRDEKGSPDPLDQKADELTGELVAKYKSNWKFPRP